MKYRLSSLTFLGFEINYAMENGLGKDITFDDIYNSLDNDQLIEILNEKTNHKIDLSLYHGEDRIVLNDMLKEASEGLRHRESRKTGIESSGLNLLMAIILEAIQIWGRKHT